MFAIVATKALNDNTKGFRYNFFGVKGLVRVRKVKSRGFKLEQGECMLKLHLGKVTIYKEVRANKKTMRILHHFAG
jgi:hypothetical protein